MGLKEDLRMAFPGATEVIVNEENLRMIQSLIEQNGVDTQVKLSNRVFFGDVYNTRMRPTRKIEGRF